MGRIILGGLSAIAAALVLAAPAQASPELAYLQLLNLRGIVVYDTARMLITGYQTCAMLDYNNGTVVAPMMVNRYADMDYVEADIIMVTAVETLCPYHDHRGE